MERGYTACKSLDQDTVKGTLLWGKHRIGQAGIPGARLEAEVLLAHSLGWTRSALLARLPEPMNPEARMKYFADIDLRISGYPLQYITGYQEFMSLPFAVAPGVLIPRPETEMLVEAVLNFCRQQSRPLSLVDVGTGSGAIAISLAHYLPGINVYATDLSPAALGRAKKNASALKAEVVFIEGDLLSPWLTCGEELSLPPRLEAVVSNPPYIPTGQLAGLQRELAYEPALALDGGPDGLEVYRRLIPQAAQVLAPGGMLALETGWDQAEGVAQLIRAGGAFSQVVVLPDLAGKDRVLTAIKNG